MLASRLGVSQQAVSAWVQGTSRPSKAEHRRDLHRLFGIHPHDWPKPKLRQKYRQARLARGVCIDCEEPTEGFIRCEACRKWHKDRRV